MKRPMLLSIRVRIGEESGPVVTFRGRDAWAFTMPHSAGPRGCTPIDTPGTRWSGYVYKLRRRGLDASHPPFGGLRWWFVCPRTNRRVRILHLPLGARRFACRRAYRLVYSSQRGTAVDRAHRGQAKIKARLTGGCDPDEWDLPPKPKWMRWRTYQRYVDKYDRYEAVLDEGSLALVARFMGRG